MTKALRLVVVALVMFPVLAACGRPSTTTSSSPTLAALWASRLTLSDITPITHDADNWWDTAPRFDVRPLNSGTRDDADTGGLTTGFAHIGTSEMLSLNYEVWSSTTIVAALIAVNKLSSGNGETGPKVGDQALYYNRKVAAGPTVYNNLVYVQVGPTLLTILWSHVEAFASTKDAGAIAAKAVSRLKAHSSARAHPSPPAPVDQSLLAPPGPQLTLLGSATLPVEVLAQMVDPSSSPAPLAGELKTNGVADFVFGDYALNLDTRMEVLTAGIVFSRFPTGGSDFIKGYFGASNLTPTGEAGGYDAASGIYVYGFGKLNRAVLMVCRSSADGEEAARACEAPMQLVSGGWHQVL